MVLPIATGALLSLISLGAVAARLSRAPLKAGGRRPKGASGPMNVSIVDYH